MLNEDELCNTVFYPACGRDFQPLVRFSHLANTFIYVDYGISENEIESSLAEVIKNLNDQLAPGKLELLTSESISKAELTDAEPILPPGFTLRRYLDPKKVREKLSQVWAKRFKLRRKFGKVVRNLQLIYIYGEGLATYSALYRGGKSAPKILVTVQSGAAFGGNYAEFEGGEGIFADFLNTCKTKPPIWVRGTGGYGVDTSGLWNIQIQGYANWYPHGINRPQHNRSHVAAFRRSEYNLDVKSEKEWKGSHGRILRLNRVEITPDTIKNTHLTIISSTILARFKQNYPTINFEYGELWLSTRFSPEVLRLKNPDTHIYVYRGDTISLLLFLNEIDRICTERKISHVITVPQGFEDEEEVLLSWVKRKGLPQKLEIMFTDELDFASLMGCSLATIRA